VGSIREGHECTCSLLCKERKKRGGVSIKENVKERNSHNISCIEGRFNRRHISRNTTTKKKKGRGRRLSKKREKGKKTLEGRGNRYVLTGGGTDNS